MEPLERFANSKFHRRESNDHVVQLATLNDRWRRLILIPPTYIPDQAIHSPVYKFTEEHAAFAQDVGGWDNVWDQGNMENNPLLNALVPDTTPLIRGTEVESASWTFMLIIDDPTCVSGQNTRPRSKQRLIAGGFCYGMDAARNDWDESCVLHFTRTTMVSDGSSSGWNNTMINDNSVRIHDVDVVSSSTVEDLSLPDSNLQDAYLLTPGEVYNSIPERDSVEVDDGIYDDDRELYSLSVTNASLSSKVTKGCQVSHELKAPLGHLQTITSALNRATLVSDTDDIRSGLSRSNNGRFDVTFSRGLPRNTSGAIRCSVGIDVSIPCTIGQLLEMYDGVEISQVGGVDMNLRYDIGDQLSTDIQTTMASMVANAVSAYGVSCRLAEVAFNANSHAGTRRFGRNTPTFRMLGYAPLYDYPMHQQEDAVELFIHYICDDLLPILTASLGDVDLFVDHDLNNKTYVRMHYRAFDEPMDGAFVVDNRLGGLCSPLIGSENHLYNNARELRDLCRLSEPVRNSLRNDPIRSESTSRYAAPKIETLSQARQEVLTDRKPFNDHKVSLDRPSRDRHQLKIKL